MKYFLIGILLTVALILTSSGIMGLVDGKGIAQIFNSFFTSEDIYHVFLRAVFVGIGVLLFFYIFYLSATEQYISGKSLDNGEYRLSKSALSKHVMLKVRTYDWLKIHKVEFGSVNGAPVLSLYVKVKPGSTFSDKIGKLVTDISHELNDNFNITGLKINLYVKDILGETEQMGDKNGYEKDAGSGPSNTLST